MIKEDTDQKRLEHMIETSKENLDDNDYSKEKQWRGNIRTGRGKRMKTSNVQKVVARTHNIISKGLPGPELVASFFHNLRCIPEPLINDNRSLFEKAFEDLADNIRDENQHYHQSTEFRISPHLLFLTCR